MIVENTNRCLEIYFCDFFLFSLSLSLSLSLPKLFVFASTSKIKIEKSFSPAVSSLYAGRVLYIAVDKILVIFALSLSPLQRKLRHPSCLLLRSPLHYYFSSSDPSTLTLLFYQLLGHLPVSCAHGGHNFRYRNFTVALTQF